MNFGKLNPTNWFSHEEKSADNLPVDRKRQGAYAPPPLETVHSEIDRVFDSFFNGMKPYFTAFEPWENNRDIARPVSGPRLLKPCLDVKAAEREYTISVELPGVEEKDISIEMENDALIISGEKRSEVTSEDEAKGYYRMERSYGSFRRILAVPDDAEVDKIAATFKDGVLNVTIPRKEVKEKKRIAINS